MSKKEVKSKVNAKLNYYDFNYRNIEHRMRNLEGVILTIIDGAIVNERQNKAVKDQIKNCIWGTTISEFQQMWKHSQESIKL